MTTRAGRRAVRRAPCVLCGHAIAGYRHELGATWVAHASCFAEFRRRAEERLELAVLDPDERYRRIRSALTRTARTLYDSHARRH